jgi:DNA-binding protein HU-beta
MTYNDLVKAVASDSGLSQVEVKKALTSLVNEVKKNAVRGESSPLPNLGAFDVKKRKARTGTNPRTKEKIEIAAKTVLAFKVSPSARDV